MDNLKKDVYLTKDLGESSALLCKSAVLVSLQKESNFYWFVFRDKELCQKISREYWFGELLVNARKYYEEMRGLKDKLFSQK